MKSIFSNHYWQNLIKINSIEIDSRDFSAELRRKVIIYFNDRHEKTAEIFCRFKIILIKIHCSLIRQYR